jgi:sec-independent protein translocase protein TatB
MFDFAWSELALIAVVALVVIGPKDLPRVLRTVGFWVGKARGIAREFQGSLDQMIREAELDSVKEHIDKATHFNFEQEVTKALDPEGELERSLSDPVLANPLIEPPKPAVETASGEGEAPPPALPEPAAPAPQIEGPDATVSAQATPTEAAPAAASASGEPSAPEKTETAIAAPAVPSPSGHA